MNKIPRSISISMKRKSTIFSASKQKLVIFRNDDLYTIVGITKSCKKRFGIPSKIVYGVENDSQEFTLYFLC